MTESIGEGAAASGDSAVDSSAFAEMIAVVRKFQDLLVATNGPRYVLDDVRSTLDGLSDRLRPWLVPVDRRVAGRCDDLPGRGHPLVPALRYDVRSADSVFGRVRLTEFFRGGGPAAHGGVLPLLFDEILGVLTNAAGRPFARTARLEVDYRKITPIGPELHFEARLDRVEGRKRFMAGRLLHDGEVLAEAVGLYVVLLPGQP